MSRSITFWNRLEGRPASDTLSRSLAAEIHDPLWLLARQWSLGEFRGEDAASLAWVELTTESLIDASWSTSATATRSLLGTACDGAVIPVQPIERALAGEDPDDPDDLSLAVELGQRFEDMAEARLDVALCRRLREALRARFAVRGATTPLGDAGVQRFLRVCGGRATDGVALYRAITRETFWPCPALTVSADERAQVQGVLNAFRAQVQEAHGLLDGASSPAWRPSRLRYEACVAAAATPDSASHSLRTHIGRDGELDWYGFDAASSFRGEVMARRRRLVPGHIRFPGMPQARWWDFESARSDFGSVTVAPGELGRLALLDFMALHGNDWFMIPFPMHVGTACRVSLLRVYDVFGDATDVPRADALHPGWSMYGTSLAGDRSGANDGFFHLPASSSFCGQHGPVLEAWRGLRDESANLAWAVMHTRTDALGDPHPAREQDNGTPRPPPPPASAGEALTRYVLQSDVPRGWVPLVPTAGDGGVVTLRVGAFVTSAQEVLLPEGRLLPRELDEREVPRVGVSLARRRVASRWIDGSLHVWMVRLRTVGVGEGSSGLRFDALANDVRETTSPSA